MLSWSEILFSFVRPFLGEPPTDKLRAAIFKIALTVVFPRFEGDVPRRSPVKGSLRLHGLSHSVSRSTLCPPALLAQVARAQSGAARRRAGRRADAHRTH